MANLTQVQEFIKNADRDTLRLIAAVHNKAAKALIQAEANAFNIGSKVTVNHHSIDSLRVFTVEKVNRKTVTVRDSRGSFRVSPNLLENYKSTPIKLV